MEIVQPGIYDYELGNFLDANGQPTDVDRRSQCPMSVDNEAVCQVLERSADGLTGAVQINAVVPNPDGTPGNPVANILWEPDADRADGVKPLPISLQVVVESGEATSGSVRLTRRA